MPNGRVPARAPQTTPVSTLTSETKRRPLPARAWSAIALTVWASYSSALASRPNALSRSAPTGRLPSGPMCYVAPNGERHKIEFLGDGQQAVFYGYHEGAKRDYQWHADRDPLKVPPSEWVSITEAEADELLTEIDELLTEQFGYERVCRGQPLTGMRASVVHVTDVDEALATLDYAGQGGGGNIHDTELGCINALIVQDTLRRQRHRRGARRSSRLRSGQSALREVGLGEGAPSP